MDEVRQGRKEEARLPSGLNEHAALATISAPIRSSPSFHYLCQGARRLSRVKLTVILWRQIGPSTMVLFKLRASL